MCGIAGIWNKNGRELSEASLRRFTDSLAHRGPDGRGYQIFNKEIGLGHRRLSILDSRSIADQPMHMTGQNLHIIFNGEVFNFIELRKELLAKKWRFRTDSDTEVILAAYKEWGMDAFHRFNGMWAIALWDNEKQELLLCRDRFGIKPLYYLNTENQLAWASETKAFNELDEHRMSIDENMLQICMADTYALEGKGHTLFQGLKQLLPGHFIRIQKGDAIEQKRWYDIQDRKLEIPESYETQQENFREIFKEACKLRMRSDVTMATALSGGVDSTAVYGMVHSLMKEHVAERSPSDWQRAFVAVFPGTDKDERAFAELAVKHTGGSAEYIEQNLKNLPERILQSTQHFHNLSSTPILALMGVYEGMHKAGVTVSLDGHGVDEMLYGYRDMVYQGFEHQKWHGKREEAEASRDVLVGLYAEEIRAEKNTRFTSDIKAAFHRRNSIIHKVGKLIKRNPNPQIVARNLLPSLSNRPYDFGRMNPFDRMVHDEFFLRTLPSLLRNFDNAAMLSSVEIRMPFMDYRMVEMAFSLPYSSKIGGGYTKRILRDSMKGVMPEAIRNRTFKVGLGAPTKEWFSGPLKDFLGDQLSSTGFKEHSLLSTKDIEGFKERQHRGEWNEATAAQMWIALNAHLIQSKNA